ncbi:MAG: alanine--tRNA ligase [Candidatus Lokiarchaeota archaeon]|nr:alanine--tRNA ligase [Candidatus Lokiarchaeota archaeon]
MILEKNELKNIFGPEKYKVKLFDEEGFVRKQCPICKDYYWTLNSESTICGDTQCLGGYQFIDLKKKKNDWDFHNTVKRWIDYFVKNGHKKVQEYPVVSRWRNDLYFTIASIGCFQPHVLNGTALPPGNPLVIPQPCIRFGGKGFNDIDNVGKTGRHLSSFVMGGQHSFNSEKMKLKGYWMDQCIELDFGFLTKILKINPLDINLREDIWMGGGNFGPCLESFSKGLEIVNSVFMQYEVLPNGSYRQMDMTVVDVGWGVERIGWFASGNLTIYEATFGPVLEKMKKNAGIKIESDLLAKYAQISGLLNVDEVDDIDKARQQIAKKLDLSYEVLSKQLGPMEATYAIADHLKTLSFAVADGAFPSNIGGGYNLRIILRRAIILNELYKLKFDLTELTHEIIDYFKKTYTRLSNANDTIDEILDIEFKKFKESRTKGENHVKRLIKDKKGLTTDKFIELYESRGIPPEVVQEIGKTLNVDIHIPGDFYVKLGELKEKSMADQEKTELKDAVIEEVSKLTPTKLLYYDHSYINKQEFNAKIIKIIDKYVILDQTLFYPTSGGQSNDIGIINEYEVINVEKVGDIVVHELKKPPSEFKDGLNVYCKIDWERRKALMRHHTATHIINSAARQVLGNHVWQGGTEKKPDRAHLDISHYKPISNEELKQIERVANDIVLENRQLHKNIMKRNEAEEKYGFIIYQGGAVPGEYLRIVQIDDWDVEACGGTHLENTAEVGTIKMISAKRIQDGVVRLEYSVGKAAINYIQKLESLLEESASTLNVGITKVPEVVRKNQDDWRRLNKEIERMRKSIAEKSVIDLKNNSLKINDIQFVFEYIKDNSVKDLIEIASNIVKNSPEFVVVLNCGEENLNIVLMAGEKAVSNKIHMGELINVIKKYGGKGGGKAELAQGGGFQLNYLEKIKEQMIEAIKKMINV